MHELEEWLSAHGMRPPLAAALEALDITTVQSLCSRYEDLRSETCIPFGSYCKLKRACMTNGQIEHEAFTNKLAKEQRKLAQDMHLVIQQAYNISRMARDPQTLAILQRELEHKKREFKLRHLVINLRCL